MLSFGDPAPFVPPIRAAGARLILQVQTLADARAAAALGADVVVAQGAEAGGHGAKRATLPLVPAVVDAIAPTPVAAAGGIADGRGLAAALVLGAAGVLAGTRFYASREALGHAAAKARLVEGAGDATLRTTVFDLVRGLRLAGSLHRARAAEPAERALAWARGRAPERRSPRNRSATSQLPRSGTSRARSCGRARRST